MADLMTLFDDILRHNQNITILSSITSSIIYSEGIIISKCLITAKAQGGRSIKPTPALPLYVRGSMTRCTLVCAACGFVSIELQENRQLRRLDVRPRVNDNEQKNS